MAEYRYTVEDRKEQLAVLVKALQDLILELSRLPDFSSRTPDYETALREAERLLCQGFSQEQLSALGRSVPDLFLRHKDWCPPLEQLPNGKWTEPEWFEVLENKLQPALEAANVLYILGYY